MSRAPDYDVLVIGGGPAGVAAALRTRWVKRYLVVPCRVAILEPSTLGGLTQMGTCIMTGPGWLYTHETIRPPLLEDVARFEIPHLRQRVRRVEKAGKYFLVSTAEGFVHTARAVVLCCGMKMLGREPELWGRGVTATSMGVEWATRKILQWVGGDSHRKIVFVGTRALDAVMELTRRHQSPEVEVLHVVEPNAGLPQSLTESPDVVVGTVVELGGEERLQRVVVERQDGSRVCLEDVDLLVIDFLSYERSPARSVACEGVVVDEAGFVQVDRRQRTSVEGLFAAGDVTGMPACAGTAMGEGIVAGFEAYRYVFRQKFGVEPALFAYYGYEGPLEAGIRELPRLGQSYGPQLLVSREHALTQALGKAGASRREVVTATLKALPLPGEALVGLEQLAAMTGQSPAALEELLDTLLELKLMTLQPLKEHDEGLGGS